jgi:hypothetical protein
MWLFEFVIGNVTIPSQVIEYDQNFLQADHPDCSIQIKLNYLPMQSVPITTNVSLNPAQARCTQYNIMW